MKKYFIAETDEELQMGDTLKLDLTKKTKNGIHSIESEIEISELSIPLLLEMGAIEEREVEEEDEQEEDDELLDFEDDEVIPQLLEDFESLEKRVEKLEEKTDKFIEMHKDFVAIIDKMMDTFKEFVTK